MDSGRKATVSHFELSLHVFSSEVKLLGAGVKTRSRGVSSGVMQSWLWHAHNAAWRSLKPNAQLLQLKHYIWTWMCSDVMGIWYIM